MPYKPQEWHYQQQAYKRHEVLLKQDYYNRTANYFQRQTTVAKQFNSWITRHSESRKSKLEKTRRLEELQSRRESLRQLLKRENELYKWELEQKKIKNKKNEDLSFKTFRQNILEKKAEQNLYYPTMYEKLSFHTINLNDNLKNVQSSDIIDEDNSIRPVTINRENQNNINQCLKKISFQTIKGNASNKLNLSKEYNELLKKSKTLNRIQKNMKFDICNLQQSLQDTNIRNAFNVNHSDMLTSTIAKGNPTFLLNKQQNNSKCEYNLENHICQMNTIDDVYQKIEHQEDDITVNQKKLSFNDSSSSTSNPIILTDSVLQTKGLLENSMSMDKFMPHNDKNEMDIKLNNNFNYYQKGNMHKKETDCARSVNISAQMFRYLQHIDLKYKILDLCKRERICTIKQYWDEALRLREMRNKLILLKNKNLYENQDLQIDDEIRKFGLNMIETRETLNKKRVKMCNSMLYSDEAKTLWKQWNTEDDKISEIEINTIRDVLLNELENEWKNLALQDKKHISHLYNRVMTKSDLHDEHKLAAEIRDMNVHQKQYMNYLVI